MTITTAVPTSRSTRSVVESPPECLIWVAIGSEPARVQGKALVLPPRRWAFGPAGQLRRPAHPSLTPWTQIVVALLPRALTRRKECCSKARQHGAKRAALLPTEPFASNDTTGARNESR